MLDEVKVYSTYRNIKTENVYVILGFGTCSEKTIPLVIYRCINIVDADRIWIRPLQLFKEKFELYLFKENV